MWDANLPRRAPLRTASIALGLLLALGPAPSEAADPALEFTSSDPRRVRSFEWAKGQALAYAFDTGDPVGPWYEAALPGREAFCMRDVAHQANGAHALGLARHTRNMLRRFAEVIAESRDFCSYWEIDRYNRPAPVDYKLRRAVEPGPRPGDEAVPSHERARRAGPEPEVQVLSGHPDPCARTW
jgi:hypothetical protein